MIKKLIGGIFMVMELGRLVYDVEVKEVGENKNKVLNNRLAINIGKDRTTYVDIVAWNKTAELMEKYFKKGNEILVEGTLINKTKLVKSGEGQSAETDTVAILITKVHFVHGNKKDVQDVDFEDIPEEDVPDFLK